MTFIEKYMMDHPNESAEETITALCPSMLGYEMHHNCINEEKNCEECWNREIPGTKPVRKPNVVDIHKLIDDTMAKKDRVITIYINGKTTSVSMRPLDNDEDKWIVTRTGNKNYYRRQIICPECRREVEKITPYCPECGTQLKGVKVKENE